MEPFEVGTLLRFYDAGVLAMYRAQPDRYEFRGDRVVGEVRSRSDQQAGAVDESYIRVRYGPRRLANGRRGIAAIRRDVEALPVEEQRRWEAFEVAERQCAEEDPAFESWIQHAFLGSWSDEEHPVHRIGVELKRIRALTDAMLGEPLFRFDDTSLLSMPTADNTEAYRSAYLNVYRLLVDGLSNDCLGRLAGKLEVTLTKPSLTLNSLKEVLPEPLEAVVHKPLKHVGAVRNSLHGVPSEGRALSAPAVDRLGEEMASLADGMEALRGWLEEALGASADTCIYRADALALFPEIRGNASVYPAIYLTTHRFRLTGKTIRAYRYGAVPRHADVPDSEALILEFEDGSAVALTISSNVGDLTPRCDGVSKGEFRFYLDIDYAPSPLE